tara:strand:- start:73 stop:651 length:579 start_codon:yes stop_codon:yes gene_type:complete
MAATLEKPRLLAKFDEQVRDAVMKEFNLTNVNDVPKLSKVVINVGVGRYLDNQKLKQDIRDTVTATLTKISGQKPIEIKAKKSVSNFKVREGAPSAFMVTIRREKMWHFLDRMISLAIPRIKDFRGLNDTSFDQAGNYSMGLTEQAVWPEINMAEFSFNHGMNINLVFENSDAKKSRFVLDQLGMPFKRDEE